MKIYEIPYTTITQTHGSSEKYIKCSEINFGQKYKFTSKNSASQKTATVFWSSQLFWYLFENVMKITEKHRIFVYYWELTDCILKKAGNKHKCKNWHDILLVVTTLDEKFMQRL